MTTENTDLQAIQKACRHFVQCAVTPEARAAAWDAFHGWVSCDRVVAQACLMALSGPCCVKTPPEGTSPEMVFTMGLPAAGKSTYVARELEATHAVIDPDEVKKTLPGYDPKNPMTTHAASKDITDRMFDDALASGDGLHVVDGTGCKPEKMIAKIQRSRAAGFTVRLVYIECTLENSLIRNSQRERLVPEYVIREKSTQIRASYAAIKSYADSVRIVNTDD